MLVTECPHCRARFRAAPEQLNLRQGQVRCGQCQGIFNAFESVVRVSAATERTLPQATPVQVVAAEVAPHGAPEASFDDSPQISSPEPELPGSPEPEPAIATAPPKSARVARAWTLGVVLLVLVLAMQLTYAYRAQLTRNYPALRPSLESVCATVGCSVPWVNDESALKLEDSELLEVPGKPGQIALQARIRNLSPSAQQFPHLELTLTDLTGQAAIRRVLRPGDYLGQNADASLVMAAGSEALLSVRLETGRIRATGYELLLFYP